MSEKRRGPDAAPRTAAEWVSLAIALILLAGVAGAIVWLWRGDPDQPARFRVERGAVRREGDQFYLPVAITNEGDRTGAQVLVEGTLAADGREEVAATTFDFIPGHSRVEGVLIFGRDPAGAAVRVASFQQP